MKAVKYIGKASYRDNLYRTYLTWEPGQVRGLPDDVADKILRHIDMFERAQHAPKKDDTSKLLADAKAAEAERDQAQIAIQSMYMEVQVMDKESLDNFAQRNYRQTIDKRHSVEDLRQQVVQMIDRFGVV